VGGQAGEAGGRLGGLGMLRLCLSRRGCSVGGGGESLGWLWLK
jgi:hypothetical protein